MTNALLFMALILGVVAVLFIPDWLARRREWRSQRGGQS